MFIKKEVEMTEIFILKRTLIIYGFIFGIALITILLIQKRWDRDMWISTLSWFGVFLLFLFLSYAGLLYFSLLITLIAFLAIREYYRMNGLWKRPLIIFSLGFILLGFYSVVSGRLRLFYLLPFFALFYSLISSLFQRPLGMNRNSGIGLMGFLYWGWAFLHFSLLRKIEGGFGSIILLGSLIALNDNTAFYIGKLYGRKRLAPEISPKKTWEGAIAGFLISFPVALLFRYTVPHIPILHLFLLAGITGIAVPTGDLIESCMKRDIGVKDSGKLIPGHGGIMDRFDSWTFSVPIFYYYLLYICR